MPIDAEAVYPSISELVPDIIRAHLSDLLVSRVKERYEQLGDKYMLPFPEHQFEYRPVNGCMIRDTRQDIEEEVVDAVFNCLVMLLKCAKSENSAKANKTYNILVSLNGIFTDLEAMKVNESF